MSKSIKIPDNRGSRITVVVNGVTWIFKAGETVTVPDEVAALFDDNAQEDVAYGRMPFQPLEAEDVYTGTEFIPVYVDPDGRMLIRMEDIDTGSGLPDVTAEDNGDVLTVVEGAWGKAEPSGGGGVFKVTVTQVGSGRDGHLLLDKNYTEIKEALEAGSSVYAEFDQTTGLEIGVLTGLTVYIAQDEYEQSYWGAAFSLPEVEGMLFSASTADGDLTVSLG